MAIVIVSTEKLELALCANQEILTTLRDAFRAFEVPENTAGAFERALTEYRGALLGLVKDPTAPTHEIDRTTLDEAQITHDEIAFAFQTASELGRVPPELARQMGAVFEEFATGLRDLQRVA